MVDVALEISSVSFRIVMQLGCVLLKIIYLYTRVVVSIQVQIIIRRDILSGHVTYLIMQVYTVRMG